jgi:hypothetical protein
VGGHDTLLWLYGANAVILTVHEIDSAYWREWRLLRLPGGIALFLLLLAGLVLVERESDAGFAISLVVSAAGVAAFALHAALLARGHPEFRTAASVTVLAAILVASLAQGALTLTLL